MLVFDFYGKENKDIHFMNEDIWFYSLSGYILNRTHNRINIDFSLIDLYENKSCCSEKMTKNLIIILEKDLRYGITQTFSEEVENLTKKVKNGVCPFCRGTGQIDPVIRHLMKDLGNINGCLCNLTDTTSSFPTTKNFSTDNVRKFSTFLKTTPNGFVIHSRQQ